jgi:hypothetical protein
MTKLIIIPEETLDTLYERTILRLREKFSHYPEFSTFVESDWKAIGDDIRRVHADCSKVYKGDKPIGKVVG